MDARTKCGHDALNQNLQRGLDIGRLAHRLGLDFLVDALHEARQHLAGAQFEYMRDIERLHLLHAFAPAHGAGHLIDQQLAVDQEEQEQEQEQAAVVAVVAVVVVVV